MMKLLTLVMKRPSDTQIRYSKVALGSFLMISGCIAFGLQQLQFNNPFLWMNLTEMGKAYASHFIVFFGAILIVIGGLDVHFLSRGYTRILQIFFGVFLIILGGVFQETATLSIAIVYPIFGLICIFAGITGKFITKKGLRAGQKITKIRV